MVHKRAFMFQAPVKSDPLQALMTAIMTRGHREVVIMEDGAERITRLIGLEPFS